MKYLFFIVLLFFSQVIVAQFLIVDEISISGNNQTKKAIIERELTFNIGDTISKEELSKRVNISRDNIYNLGLFNFVNSEVQYIDSTHIRVLYSVLERWYVWPVPIVEQAGRNLGEWIYEGDFKKINVGLYFLIDNVRGRNETFVLKLRTGWREQYGFLYAIPSLNKKKTWGAEISFSTFRQKKFLINTSDINEPLYFNAQTYAFAQHRGWLTFMYRPNLNFTHYFNLRYNNIAISDSALKVNNYYIGENRKSMQYFSLSYNPVFDKRNIDAFPTDGYYASCEIKRNGFALFKNDVSNFQVDFKTSVFTPIHSRWFMANELQGALNTIDHPSYLFQQTLGYIDFIRGFEMNTIEGNSYLFNKNSLYYNLIKTRTRSFGKEKYQKFLKIHYALYANANIDLAVVNDKYNTQLLQNTGLYGYGLGLTLVTYYDKVFRLEYSTNSLGVGRFFVHMAASF